MTQPDGQPLIGQEVHITSSEIPDFDEYVVSNSAGEVFFTIDTNNVNSGEDKYGLMVNKCILDSL